MKKKRFLSLLTASGLSAVTAGTCISAMPVCTVSAAAQAILINEVCTKNTTKAAPDGQFYDYVELYNDSDAAVSLAGFGLSDDAAQPMRYVFPSDATVPAKGFYVVYCGTMTEDAGATFGLSKNGETLILSGTAGTAMDTVEVPALAADTAYGRVPDGSTSFSVLTSLSPGSTNPAAQAEIVVPEPVFSQESGFYTSGFDLTLSAENGCTIYYTTDGSDPTTAATKYTGAIKVYDRSSEANVYAAKTDISQSYQPPSDPVDKAMIIRAVCVDSAGNVSNIVTNSYFIGYTQSDYAMNMRVISLVTDPDNLFDNEKGIYVYGKTYTDWKNSADYSPMAQSWEIPGNCTQSGREWERPAQFTVFENGQATYTAGVGIRIHGAATRSAAQKSFNLYARLDYGTRKIQYDFFNGELTDENGKVIKSFDKLTLRNGGNDEKTKIRDRLNQELLQGRKFGTQAQTECVVFLDGEFWGTYNIVEKLGKEYISAHYDVKEDNVCMIKTDELSDGTAQGWADYEALKQLALSGGADLPSKIASIMDTESFADYMAAEIILGNSDFGSNNYCLWKTESVDSSNAYADGKWRWILFDTEYGQGLYNQSNANTSILSKLRQQANSGEWLPSLFFNLLKTDEQFCRDFTAAYYDMCNECIKPEVATARLSELTELYKPSMTATIKRFSMGGGSGWGAFPGFGDWGDWGIPGQPGQPGQPDQPGNTQDNSESTFTNEISSIQSFWQGRSSASMNEMMQYLQSNNLGGIKSQLVTVSVESAQPVKFNTLTLPAGSWSGKYPQGLLCTASAPAGLVKWQTSNLTLEGCTETNRNISFTSAESSASLKAVFDGTAPAYTTSDVQALLNHLLNKKALTTQDAAKYDLDGNKKLTAADLSLMKRAIL